MLNESFKISLLVYCNILIFFFLILISNSRIGRISKLKWTFKIVFVYLI